MTSCTVFCMFERLKFLLSFICVPFYMLFLISIGQALRQPERIRRYMSFYWLVISAGVADLWYLLHYYFLNLFRKWGWLIWPAELVPFYTFLTALFLQQSQVLATLLMGVNRLFALCWPIRYRVRWTPALTLKTVALQWLLSLITVLPPAFGCQLQIPQNHTENFVANRQECAKIVFGTQVTTQLTTAVTLVVLYSIMFVRVRKQSRKVANAKVSHRRQEERKVQQNLALAGGAISAVLVLYAASSAALPLVGFNFKSLKPVVLLMYNFTSTLLSVINPFMLVTMCESMREGMVKLCCRKDATTADKKGEELEIK